MTFADRTAAVVPFGFTERQARFLVTVMLHTRASVSAASTVHLPVSNTGRRWPICSRPSSPEDSPRRRRARTVGPASFTFITNLSTPRSESPRIGTGDRRPWLEQWSA
jgi:hypothetical protein